MINLCIQELASEKTVSLDKLSELTGIPLKVIQEYTILENITEPIAEDLIKIAKALDVSTMRLVQPKIERKALKFKIREIAEEKGLTIEDLSQVSGIHPAILGFYSTQPVCKQKLQELEDQHQYLKKITDVLQCRIEDLQIESELPTTKLRFQELIEEKGLTTESLMMLADVPREFLNLIANQPVDISTFRSEDINFENVDFSGNKRRKNVCDWLPNCFPGCPCNR